MKPILLIICLLPLISISAQIGFLDHRYVWTETFQCSGSQWTETNRYTVDSLPIVFEENEYYEVLISPTPSGENFTGTGNYIRSDDSNRVFSYNGMTAKLEYDFNFAVGDTFKTHNDYDCVMIVGDIDTITLETGEQRRKWILYESGYDYHPEYEAGYFYWIEGIGHQLGVFGNSYMCQIDGCGNYMLCVNLDNTLIYKAPHWLDTCWVTISATVDPYLDKIQIHPNPASDFFEISDPEEHIKAVFIITLNGNSLHPQIENKIGIGDLAPGYYVLRLDLKNGNRAYRKIIKL